MASAFLAGRYFTIPGISTVRGIPAAETLFVSASPGHTSFTPSHFTLRPNFHNSPHEWVGLISERLIDFIRVHLSQTGGQTPARKIAALAEWFQVRTAWHGPCG